MKKRRMSLQDKAEAALKEAIRRLVAWHKKTGRPLVIWKNGRVVHLSPNRVK